MKGNRSTEAIFHEQTASPAKQFSMNGETPQPGQIPADRYTGQNFTVACTYTVRGSPRYLPLLLSSYERV